MQINPIVFVIFRGSAPPVPPLDQLMVSLHRGIVSWVGFDICDCLKLHTLELSLKQINKILGQIDGYLFFLPFCSEKKICEKPRRPYRLWKNADVC